MEATIKKALREAGKILMTNFGKIQNYNVKENRFPGHNIIAEETGYKYKNSQYT